MVGLDIEDIGLCFPERVDGLVGCFEPERLELFGEVVGCQPVPDVMPEFIDRRVVEGFDAQADQGQPALPASREDLPRGPRH